MIIVISLGANDFKAIRSQNLVAVERSFSFESSQMSISTLIPFLLYLDDLISDVDCRPVSVYFGTVSEQFIHGSGVQ